MIKWAPGCYLLKRVGFLLACFLMPIFSLSQPTNHSPRDINFFQLSVTQGLSSGLTNAMCTDKNGNLWIGTPEGLNRFNGKTVVNFFSRNVPQLKNDDILELVCDAENFLWIKCAGGHITLLDAQGNFHKVSIVENEVPVPVLRILKTGGPGVILFTARGFYSFRKNRLLPGDSLTLSHFDHFSISSIDSQRANQYTQIEPYDANSYIFYNGNLIYITDLKQRQVKKVIEFPGLQILIHWKNGQLLVYDKKEALIKSIGVSDGRVGYPFLGITDQQGKALSTRILSAVAIDSNRLLITSQRDGLYLFDKSFNLLSRFTHRPGDEASLLNDRPRVICNTSNGWVFIGSRLSGINYFKTDVAVGQKSFFSDGQGNSYDSYINSILSANNETFYIGTGNNLIKWNRRFNTVAFINYASFDKQPVINEEGTANLSFDKLGRLWFITSTKGIVVIDKNDRLLKRFPMDTSTAGGLQATWAEHITSGPDGWVWIATNKGVRRVNPLNFETDNLSKPGFKELNTISANHIFFDHKGNLWLSTQAKGLWYYTFSTETLIQFNLSSGGISNRYFTVCQDSARTVYAGSDNGMQLFLTDGTTKTISQKDGLLNKSVDILLTDKNNRVWMGNKTGIACYNPADKSLRYFGESYGLSPHRLRSWGFSMEQGGDIFWATEKGLQYFNPDDLYNYKLVFKTFISRMETPGLSEDISGNPVYRLNAADNDVSFYFHTNEYVNRNQNLYKYKLEGQDKDWRTLVNQHSIRYSALAPGKYVFKLRASNDGSNWMNAENEVVVYIKPPFYKTGWFLLVSLVLLAAVLFIFLRIRDERIREKEADSTALHKVKADSYRMQLETEQVTRFFTSTIHQHEHIDGMLWDVAKNLIGKLGFEECMIYLWNQDNTVLVQKAGYGKKGAMEMVDEKIQYNIPKGKGIVGAAAGSATAVLVNDTSVDERYFAVDGKIMQSELCVPIIYRNEVLGAFNTEHSQKNFFTPWHLQVLTTIASICAEKMEKIKAQQLSQKKEHEVLQLSKDLANWQLAALRAQMNPHFLYNAMNSIQQFVLKNDIENASNYISKFSTLLRKVLHTAKERLIPLEEEITQLTLYLEIEQLRLGPGFSYTIHGGPDFEDDGIKIPSMLLQPIVENALKHGLPLKKGEKKLEIFLEMPSDDRLHIMITDNGIGRSHAARIKLQQDKLLPRKSEGMGLVEQRLHLFNKNSLYNSIEVTDLVETNKDYPGTKVSIVILLDS